MVERPLREETTRHGSGVSSIIIDDTPYGIASARATTENELMFWVFKKEFWAGGIVLYAYLNDILKFIETLGEKPVAFGVMK